ncbi:hypothetical protein AAZX31_09G026300 [Glycine max]|uniref:Uncharacterized protein n=1 Tax=Glycine max TaxID=3847 RepID=A0A0R0I2W9_SOYBN|nr:hypothetical protein GYH30_023836 [Glycine max]
MLVLPLWPSAHVTPGQQNGPLLVSCLLMQGLTSIYGIMRNSRCISFSLGGYRYYPPKQWHDWGEQDPFENIWIEPPKDFSGFT